MVLFTGETVEEAIEKGLETLGVSRVKAHITVIAREKKGFFGIGKKLAQVEIRPLVQVDQTIKEVQIEEEPVQPTESVTSTSVEEPEVTEEATEEVIEEAPKGPRLVETVSKEKVVEEKEEEAKPAKASVISLSERRQKQAEQAKDEATTKETVKKETAQQPEEKTDEKTKTRPPLSKDIEKASQEVLAYVEKVIYEMDVEATIEATHNRRNIFLQIETPDAGRVIGYHGKVLKSLQLLAQNYLHDHYSKNFSVTLNVHDYMEHRTETLIEYAKKMSERVLETGRDAAMDPMSNQERKIIHKTVSRIEGVASYSEGSDPNRYVVITLSE